MDWPELAYDDIVEVIASGSRRTGRSWGTAATRRCGLAVAAVAFALGAVRRRAVRPAVAAAAPASRSAVAALLTVARHRAVPGAFADAKAGGVVAGCALPYAFAGGACSPRPTGATLPHLGAPSLLLGSAALLVFGVVGYLGAAHVPASSWPARRRRRRLLGAVLCLAGMSGAAPPRSR